MYLYVGSIAVIISIYIWVLIDSCGSLGTGATGMDDAELGGASLTRFGSLKRAHISRSRTAPTSFYIRVGALRECFWPLQCLSTFCLIDQLFTTLMQHLVRNIILKH